MNTNTAQVVSILNKSIITIAIITGLFLLCVIVTDHLIKYNEARIERGVQERIEQLHERDADKLLHQPAELAPARVTC